ncbi:hypothetical protein Tco_0246755 [Tanacetum coccineum]
MANVLGTLKAANILASGGLKSVFTPASPPVALASATVSLASEKDPTAAVVTTASAITPYTRRIRASRGVAIRSSSPIPVNIPSINKEDKGKGIMTEPEKPIKKKVQEQMSEQLARELEEEFAHEDQSIREQTERDAEIARIQAEEELQGMIAELDRSNEMIAKQMSEYEQAEEDLSLEKRWSNFYTSILRSNAGWKAKDFKGMTFEQIEEKFIPVGKSSQTLRSQKLKTTEASGTEVKDSEEIMNLQQWVVLDKDREGKSDLQVKDRFKPELPKSNMEKCLYWPLKVLFEPVGSDGLWQCQAPIKKWKLYSTCRAFLLLDIMVPTASVIATDDVSTVEDFPLQYEDKIYTRQRRVICIFRMYCTLKAANILASGGLKSVFTTTSPPVTIASATVSPAIATGSEKDPTAAVVTTASAITPYTRRTRASRGVAIRSSSPIPVNIPSISKEDKGKGIMTEPEKPIKKKGQEQMSEQLARELEEEFAHEYQSIRDQTERDAEVARIQAEEELQGMIAELDRISKDLAQIKKYQAQQSKLASNTKRRKFYTSILRSNAGWKAKDFKGMTFEQIEEKFIPKGVKKLKTTKASGTEVKDSEEIMNLQQWAVLVRKEALVDVTLSKDKSPIYDWKIVKDKIREVYQIFRVGQAPKAYPYFDTMLKEFDREDVVTLWKLVKDRFKLELPKSNMEKCLYWPLKVMFEPVGSDGLWQCQAPIKKWKLYSTCRVHCLSMEGMIIYMLDDVEYPLSKDTLQRMLDHKCEVNEFNEYHI